MSGQCFQERLGRDEGREEANKNPFTAGLKAIPKGPEESLKLQYNVSMVCVSILTQGKDAGRLTSEVQALKLAF